MVSQNTVTRKLRMTERFFIIWLWFFIIGGIALTYYGKDVSLLESLIVGPILGIVVGISTGILIDGIRKYRHTEGKAIILGWFGAAVGCIWCLNTVFHWQAKCIAIEFMWNLLAVASIAGAAGSLFFGTAKIRILRFNRNKKEVRITYK